MEDCHRRNLPEDIQRSTDLASIVEQPEGQELRRSSKLPLVQDEEGDANESHYQTDYDPRVGPGVRDTTPLQSENEAGNETKHDDGADPVEGGETEHERVDRGVPLSASPASDLCTGERLDFLAHLASWLRSEDENDDKDGQSSDGPGRN